MLEVASFSSAERAALTDVLRIHQQRRGAPSLEGASEPGTPIAYGPEGMWLTRWGAPEDVHSHVHLFDPRFGWSAPLDALHDVAAVDAWDCAAQQCVMTLSFEFAPAQTFTWSRTTAFGASSLHATNTTPTTRLHALEFHQDPNEVRIAWASGEQTIVPMGAAVLACTRGRAELREIAFSCLLRSNHGVLRRRYRCQE